MNKNLHKQAEMSWPEFETLVKTTDFAILPVGAIEQHGPHLPFGADNIIGEYIADRLGESTGAIVLPCLQYTPSFSLRLFPGTVCVSDELFASLLVELAECYYRHGIHTLYILIAHYGAMAACKTAERKLLLTSQAQMVNLTLPGINEAMQKFCKSKRWHPSYVHSEEFETSLVLAIKPEMVDMSKAVAEYPTIDPLFGPISIPWSDFTRSGVVGDATTASAEKGRAMLELIIERSLELIHYHQATLKKTKQTG